MLVCLNAWSRSTFVESTAVKLQSFSGFVRAIFSADPAAASAPPIDNNVPATPVAYEPNTSGAGSGAPAQTKGVAMSAAAQRQAKLRAHNEAMMRKQQEAQQSAAVEESAPAPQTVDERAQLESKKKAAAAKPAPKKKGGWFGSKKK